MRDHFPQLQVIATTHSPLVVANFEANHVVAMRRLPDYVEAEPIPVSMLGWSADEVLTGPGFDMDTLREPETEGLKAEYAALFAKSNRTAEDNAKLGELRERLEPRIHQQLSAKGAKAQAIALFEQWLQERWERQPPDKPDKRERVLEEARIYMAGLAGEGDETP